MAIAAIDLAPSAPIYLFYDPAFTDTVDPPGTLTSAEGSELLQSLQFLGHNVTTFVGTGQDSWLDAAANAEVIVIPQLESALNLSAGAAFALKQFVDSGGTLIVLGGVPNNGTALINDLFAKSFVEKDFVIEAAAKTGDVVGTFGAGPSSIGAAGGNDFTSAWTAASIGDAESFYEDSAGDSAVAAFQYGLGQVIWLGWNWNNAVPFQGMQDSNWLNVLDRAISKAEGPSGNLIEGTKKDDKIGFDIVGKKYNSTNLDDVAPNLKKGDDVAKGADGHDVFYGGDGDDKLYGEDGNDTLIGCYGQDKLVGGDGGDWFQFEAKPGGANLDKIKDYEDGIDKIVLASKMYKAFSPGVMSAQDFADHISYTGKGVLKYNGKVFAKIGQGHDIEETDFLIL